MVYFLKMILKLLLRKKKAEFILLLLVLAVASFLRLYRIEDYLIFLGDEGRDALVVKRIIVDHKFTLLGPVASIAPFHLGPIYYYFMLPFLWAFRLDPVGPAVMVALFGIATVFLVYLVGKDFFNAKVGLLAAALYAISPLVIVHSRSSWNPNLMPFFSLLLVWLLRRAAGKENNLVLGLIGFLFGITLQLHYLAVFLAVLLGSYFLLFFPQRKKIKSYFWLLGGFVFGWSPFILFELRHNFPNFRTLYWFLSSGRETGFVVEKFFPIVKDVFFRLFSHLVANKHSLLSTSLLLSLPVFIFFWLKERNKPKAFKTYSLLLLWLFIGVGFFGFFKGNIYDYYFSFMFALPFLMVSFSLIKVAEQGRIGLFLAGLLVLGLILVNLQGNPFRQTANRQLEQTRKIASFIIEKTEGKPFNVALISKNNTDYAYRYFLEIWGRPAVIIENLQVDPGRKTVTGQLLVICEDIPCFPVGHHLWEIAGFGMAEMESEWDVYGVKVYKLIHLQTQKE